MEFEKLSSEYTGAKASDYDAARMGGPEWPKEQAITSRYLATLPSGATIVDIPVGTGRFLEFYKKYGLAATGLDASLDMLASAKAKASELALDIKLAQGDIRRIPAADKSFDAALCVRFVNWVDFAGMEAVFKELDRVARSTIITSIRVRPRPRTPLQWLGQRWTDLRRRDAELNFHTTEDTLAMFSRIGWKIVDSEVVRSRGDQTKYTMYLLHRISQT